jgi:hypothetical protein
MNRIDSTVADVVSRLTGESWYLDTTYTEPTWDGALIYMVCRDGEYFHVSNEGKYVSAGRYYDEQAHNYVPISKPTFQKDNQS